MPKLTDEQAVEYKHAYKAWVQALIDALGGRASDLYRKLSAGASLDDPIFKISDATVRTWQSRGTLPDDRYGALTRLATLMLEHVKTAPESTVEELDFLEIVERLSDHRNSTSKRGKLVDRVGRQLYEAGAISFEPISVINLNGVDLNLGSGLFDGQLPPYCPREIDLEIQQVLNSPSQRLLVIVGQPKSGKTRTLIENLKASSLSNSMIYWLDSVNGSVDQIINALPESETKNSIAVLDDLQFFKFEGDGSLNQSVFDKLKKRCMVVATLHTSSVAQWKASRIDRAHEAWGNTPSSPTQTLQRMLADSGVELNAGLSDEEELALNTIFDESMLRENSFKQLGSALSASQVLIGRAQKLQSSVDPISVSVFKSLIHCRIIYPTGFDFSDIEEFARLELEAMSNQQWDDAVFGKLKNYCTTGMHAESPHAILMRTIADPNIYTLFDPIWDSIKPGAWSAAAIAIENDDLDLAFLASCASENGYHLEALRLTGQRGLENSGEAQFLMGWYGLPLLDFDHTDRWWRKAISSGYHEAKGALGGLLVQLDRLEEAEVFLSEARELGDKTVGNDLGLIYLYKGELDMAERLFKEAAEEYGALATHNLGLVSSYRGDFLKAEEYFLSSHQAGNHFGSLSLGGILLNRGEFSRAEELLKEALSSGNPLAIHYLGLLYLNTGELIKAEAYFKRFIETTDPVYSIGGEIEKFREVGADSFLGVVSPRDHKNAISAAEYHLGTISQTRGEIEEAEMHFRKSHELGSSWAANDLGLICLNRGDLLEAEQLFSEAERAGHAMATNNLGVIKLMQGNQDAAEDLYRQASDAGVALAASNLGVMYWNRGETDSALPLLELGLKGGVSESILLLGDIAFEEKDFEKATELYKLAREKGEQRGNLGLGFIAFERKDFDAAEDLFGIAQSNDVLGSLYWLARTLLEKGQEEDAEKLFREAAESGDADAMLAVGLITKKGDASKWFTQSYEAGADDCLDEIIEYYMAAGDQEKVEEWKNLRDSDSTAH